MLAELHASGMSTITDLSGDSSLSWLGRAAQRGNHVGINHEIRHRLSVMQAFPSVKTLIIFASAAMRDQDDEWDDARNFSEKVMT